MKGNQIRNKGFGLVETVIAIAILFTVLGTSVSLSRYAVRSSSDSQVRIVAYNLAQQKMENIRRDRDNNWLTAGTSWSNGWCQAQTETANSQYPPLDFSVVTTCSESAATDVNASDIKKIKVIVSWQDQAGTKFVTTETHLTNWIQY